MQDNFFNNYEIFFSPEFNALNNLLINDDFQLYEKIAFKLNCNPCLIVLNTNKWFVNYIIEFQCWNTLKLCLKYSQNYNKIFSTDFTDEIRFKFCHWFFFIPSEFSRQFLIHLLFSVHDVILLEQVMNCALQYALSFNDTVVQNLFSRWKFVFNWEELTSIFWGCDENNIVFVKVL